MVSALIAETRLLTKVFTAVVFTMIPSVKYSKRLMKHYDTPR